MTCRTCLARCSPAPSASLHSSMDKVEAGGIRRHLCSETDHDPVGICQQMGIWCNDINSQGKDLCDSRGSPKAYSTGYHLCASTNCCCLQGGEFGIGMLVLLLQRHYGTNAAGIIMPHEVRSHFKRMPQCASTAREAKQADQAQGDSGATRLPALSCLIQG